MLWILISSEVGDGFDLADVGGHREQCRPDEYIAAVEHLVTGGIGDAVAEDSRGYCYVGGVQCLSRMFKCG